MSFLTQPTVVVALALGMLFLNLVCLIIICCLLNAIIKRLDGDKTEDTAPVEEAVTETSVATAPVYAPIENKQELIAAISCVIAEELGTDVSAIRIKSIKRVGAPCANASVPAQNRQELVAAISCAIAEELGTDVSAIRIKSIKQI